MREMAAVRRAKRAKRTERAREGAQRARRGAGRKMKKSKAVKSVTDLKNTQDHLTPKSPIHSFSIIEKKTMIGNPKNYEKS